jgi:hypothetical protein
MLRVTLEALMYRILTVYRLDEGLNSTMAGGDYLKVERRPLEPLAK